MYAIRPDGVRPNEAELNVDTLNKGSGINQVLIVERCPMEEINIMLIIHGISHSETGIIPFIFMT